MIIEKNKSHTKEPLLFLHGYLSNSKSFSYQVKYFSKYFDLYFLDLKGFGENKGMEYPYSLDDYILEVIDYLKQNNLEKVNVIAHSFGGRIAIKMGVLYPQYFDKIVLTGSAGLKPRFSIKKFFRKLVFKILSKIIDKKKLACFYSSDYNALSSVMKKSFIKIINENLDIYATKLQQRTLIINGKLDNQTPPYMAKRLHKYIKNSKLKFIKNASHFCFIDRPFEFNREVGEFLLR